jgi:hypothetical protein
MDDLLISFGSSLKAGKDNKVSGYLVLFGDEDAPDLEGDYFTKDTDFDIVGGQKTAIYFNHRLPLKTRKGGQIAVKEKIGEGVLTVDDKGVFVDAVLYNREMYEEVLSSCGWSSGTAPHLVDRKKSGKAYHIERWPLGLDASITPTPANPHPENRTLTLKSYREWLDVEVLEPMKAINGEALFNDSLQQREMQTWDLWSAVQNGARKIAEAASARDVTGVEVNITEATQALVSAYAQKLILAIASQIEDYLNSEYTNEPFYLKSLFDQFTTDGKPVSELDPDSHSLLVVSALREVAKRFRGNHEARVKSGRVLSDKNRQRIVDRLKEIQSVMDDLNSLLDESMPMASDAEQRKALSTFLRLRYEANRGATHA